MALDGKARTFIKLLNVISLMFGLVIFGVSIAGIASAQHVFSVHLFIVILVFIVFMGIFSILHICLMFKIKDHYDVHSDTARPAAAPEASKQMGRANEGFDAPDGPGKCVDRHSVSVTRWVNNYVPFGDYPKGQSVVVIKDQVLEQ